MNGASCTMSKSPLTLFKLLNKALSNTGLCSELALPLAFETLFEIVFMCAVYFCGT